MFEKFIEDKKLGGINCVVWKNGQTLLEESYGYKNLDTREVMTIDTLFRISSMTKPITSVMAMMLYEAKRFQLDDPISKWFPQFRNMKVVKIDNEGFEEAKREITVLDLLTHRAGFTYSEFQQGKIREKYTVLGGDIDSNLTNDQWVTALSNLPLVSQPGELFNYGRSTDLLGLLISKIEGKPLSKVMEEKIFTPLSMTDTFFDVPDDKKGRCASNMGYDELGELINLETVPLKMALKERPTDLEYQSGGQGLWSTLGDYLKFTKLFVENGSSDGIRLLKEDTVKVMCTNHLNDFQRQNSKLMGNPMFQEHYGFGLGLAVVTKESTYGSIPCTGSIGSVGWPGAYGGWWSADPSKKQISIFLTHSMTVPAQLAQGIGFDLYEAIDIFSNYAKEKI